ncbi:MAG: hypothetical protein ACYC09_10355 [Bacteroidota bacterium]
MKNMLLMLLLPLIVFGQRPNQMVGRSAERLDSFKKVRMLEALKLDEKTGMKLINRYNDHREAVKTLEQDRMSVIEKLEKQTASGASDGEYLAAFKELSEIERKIAEARSRYISELKDVLTPKQIAEYLVFEKNFVREIRSAIRDVQKERMKRER